MDLDHVMLLIRALHGAPMTVLLMMRLENRPVSLARLITLTGYTDKTVSRALKSLISFDLVVRLARFGSWQLTRGVKQLPLVFTLPALEAPDPGREMEMSEVQRDGISPCPGSSVVVVLPKEERMKPPNNTPRGYGNSPSLAIGKVPVAAVLALVELGISRKRADKSVAAAVERGEDEASILAKIAAGIAYCNSPASEGIRTPAQLIAARIEDGAPFTSAAFAERPVFGSKSDQHRQARRRRNQEYEDYWDGKLKEKQAQQKREKGSTE